MSDKDKAFVEGLSDKELIERLNYLRHGIEPDENYGMPDWVGPQTIMCLNEIDKRVDRLDLLSESRMLTGRECAVLALFNHATKAENDERACPGCGRIETGKNIRNYGKCGDCILKDIQDKEGK